MADFIIRTATPADVHIIMDLVKRQYGKLNYDNALYQSDTLTHRINEKMYRFFIAFSDEKPAGMVCLKEHPDFEYTLEGCTLTVLPEYRGNGIAKALMDTMRQNYEKSDADSVFYSILTNSTLEQDREFENGFSPTGIALDRFYFDKNAENLKDENLPRRRHHIFMCKPLLKKKTGKLFIPKELEEIVCGIYDDLGVIIGNEKAPETPWGGIIYKQHKYEEIFTEYLSEPPDDYSVNAFLDLANENCPVEYYKLRKLNYVFTGLKPLQTNAEYIIMHRAPDGIKKSLDETKTLAAFDKIKNKLGEL
jgi:N-acetylglutamate synthase-like GNAT family acetyltransferase